MWSRSPHRTHIYRSEKLHRGLAQDEIDLWVSRALLGVGALELAIGVVVGRAVVGARQGSHVVAVLGPEGDADVMLNLHPFELPAKGATDSTSHTGEALWFEV